MRVQQWSAHRICRQDGCLMRLSRYNPSKFCTVHNEGMTHPEQRKFRYGMVVGLHKKARVVDPAGGDSKVRYPANKTIRINAHRT